MIRQVSRHTAIVGLRRAPAPSQPAFSEVARLTRPTSAAVTGKIDVRGLVELEAA
jgi:hypothetical protein